MSAEARHELGARLRLEPQVADHVAGGHVVEQHAGEVGVAAGLVPDGAVLDPDRGGRRDVRQSVAAPTQQELVRLGAVVLPDLDDEVDEGGVTVLDDRPVEGADGGDRAVLAAEPPLGGQPPGQGGRDLVDVVLGHGLAHSMLLRSPSSPSSTSWNQ